LGIRNLDTHITGGQRSYEKTFKLKHSNNNVHIHKTKIIHQTDAKLAGSNSQTTFASHQKNEPNVLETPTKKGEAMFSVKRDGADVIEWI
jgi:hypothetical protein